MMILRGARIIDPSSRINQVGDILVSEGKIIKLDQARGMNRALAKMAEIATKEGENLPEKILCITHVNCPERAQFVADHFKAMGICKEIFITEAMGVSTIYAGDGGIVIGFV